MANLIAPSAADRREDHADWLELRAIQSRDQNSSIQDLVQVIRRTGTIEEIDLDDGDEDMLDPGSEKTQVVAVDAFSEIEDRYASCGGDSGFYPFRLESQYIELRTNPAESPYLFLLLLSKFGKDAGPRRSDGAELFELLCVHAAVHYLGGTTSGVESYHFGAPRRSTPPRFVDALNDMCRRMGEGQGCRCDRPTIRDQKDAKLDVTVWRPFHDARPGKLIGFGQCATGKDWADKLTELQPQTFCGMWMLDSPAVPPVRLFFVPFRIENRAWLRAAMHGGIIFDRCRIVAHLHGINGGLANKCVQWTAHVLKEHLRF